MGCMKVGVVLSNCILTSSERIAEWIAKWKWTGQVIVEQRI